MILYLDASALVKRYIQEKGSLQVNDWIGTARVVTTSLISRFEVAAAISRAGRMNLITKDEAHEAIDQFRSEWESYHRLPVNENTVMRADFLACEYHLKGFDATHLACALIWQETLGMSIAMASFDKQLLEAAREVKMLIPGESE